MDEYNKQKQTPRVRKQVRGYWKGERWEGR